jgi:pimeloyl-ACP methyl ester carboxylesterase
LHTAVQHVSRFEHGGGALVAESLGTREAPHLIFLHGWGVTRESLRGIAVLFQSSHRCHLIDLPGFGEAPMPPEDWDTSCYTDLVQEYLSDRVRGSIVLVGHSFGGRVALRLAARRPMQVRGLVLMGVPGLRLRQPLPVRVRRAGIRTLRRALRAAALVTGPSLLAWHSRTFGSADYRAASGPLRPVLVRVVNEDLRQSAESVECPTLLIWGTDDRETPPALAAEYRRILGERARLHLLPHKDHHLYAGTGAHLCAYKIRSWLAHVEQS